MQTTLSPALDAFVSDLTPHLDGTLRLDTMTRTLYASDASLYQMQPLAVLIPRTVEDIVRTVQTAATHNLPVLPRGGGSSLAGQAMGPAVVIDCTNHLNQVLELDEEAGRVRVQPGITLDALNTHLKPYGWMVGPDPSSGSRATLGGMVATNATGTHSILYGNMIRHVERIRAVLADGSEAVFEPVDSATWARKAEGDTLEAHIYQGVDELLASGSAVIARDTTSHWRRNNGYRLEALLPSGDGQPVDRNLAALLCGSEGTLAISTELDIRLVRRPQKTVVGIVHFDARRTALTSVTRILETEPSAVELFDGVAIAQARSAPGFADQVNSFIEGDPEAVLLTEYYGDTDDALHAQLDALEEAMQGISTGLVRAVEPDHIDTVWRVRKEGLGLVMGVKGPYKPVALIEDASVPVEHLADYIDDLEALLVSTDTPAVYYAHASAGCLHVRPFLDTRSDTGTQKIRTIGHGAMELAKKYGGALSSEHGDGIVRGWLNEDFLGEELYALNRRLKRVFDPDNRLNPGKIVDVPSPTDHLRMGPGTEMKARPEAMDWSADGGFGAAVELCNGNGACRKLQSGTMCPSFMATREEKDSTRGRANALRAVLSGRLPQEAWTGPQMTEVMDLCIQCKACKTECPSNVDMGKMKTEWLTDYWKVHRMPLRTRLFAHLPKVSRLVAGPLAGPVNAVNRLAPVRWMLDKTLGISKERELPPFAKRAFTDSWTPAPREGRAPVLLFADTFNNCHHPEVAHAAASFLERAGFSVTPTGKSLCCGRTLLSKGCVAEARQEARRTVLDLYPQARAGVPIVGLEPSCILTLRDEFLSLLPKDPKARAVADQVVTFEEFVARQADAGALDHLQWTDAARTVLVHGHCHQKALSGTTPSARCLGLPPNYQVEVLDTSCCGMAGSFGYEKEHVAISRTMAERRLAPAVRAASTDTLVVAAGTSCRAQVDEVTGRIALHPAQILQDALV